MATSATLSGYPEVSSVDVFQGSGASPGKIVVDTLVVGSGGVSKLPLTTSLSITARSKSFNWAGLRVCKSPRQHGAFMRTVLEDSRWILRDVTLGANYNERDCNGVLFPETERTIGQLVALIASASGLSISTTNLPDIKPLADWRGKSAEVALDELLERTGCRMVYRPTSSQYVVSGGASGVLADLSERSYRQAPPPRVRNLIVRTAPITYEEEFTCKAVVWNSDNEIEEVENPEGLFNNFVDIADALQRSRYQQSALRLWQPQTEIDGVLLGRRALSVMTGDSDQAYCGCTFVKPALADTPRYTPLVQPDGNHPLSLSLTGGGKVFQCQHPYVQVGAGGEIQTEATVVCAYHKIVAGSLERQSETVLVDATAATDMVVTCDWIRPVDSDQDDIDGSEWDNVLAGVATALAEKYAAVPQHIEFAFIADHDGIGQVGAVRYFLKLGAHAEARTSIAFNFDPSDARGF